jgi:hypothetical protein
MPPKHRQLCAPCPKASRNAFQSLVDPPNDRNNLSFDGGDEKTDGSDDNTVVIMNLHNSGLPASQQYHPMILSTNIQDWLVKSIVDISNENMTMHNNFEQRLFKIEERVIALKTDQHWLFDDVNSKMDNLLQKMDAAWTENTALHEAYRASREETAALKAPVDTLTKKLHENTVISAPPSPETAASSTSMEEITMQLSNVEHDLQDVLDAVRNPPGKRKQCTSSQDNEPTMPTNR